MKKNLTEGQKAKKVEAILRWADLKSGNVTRTAKEIADAVYGINSLNTMQRHASHVQVAIDYLNAIASKNMEVGDADVRDILAGAYRGSISEANAMTLGQFAIDEEVEF